MPEEHLTNEEIGAIDVPTQFDAPDPGMALVEVNKLIRGPEAREEFEVNGSGLAVAVLDTGLRVTHVDFAGRVLEQVNFTSDNGGDRDDAADGHGHGTNVGGIVVAGDVHEGIAPRGNIVPMKVMKNNGGGSFAAIRDALEWVIDNHERLGITVVCMSLAGRRNHQSDETFDSETVTARIKTLRENKVAVVIAAGNDFFTHRSEQGMAFPAILRQSVSVGAVFDDFGGPFAYASGARASVAAPDRITPFSQRLHETVNADCQTDIFAPGAPVKSSGINNDHGESEQAGTSQATPVVAGVIMLMQELHQRLFGELPEVADLVRWIRDSAVTINDGDDEQDNVNNTGLDFLRIDALSALEAVQQAHDDASV